MKKMKLHQMVAWVLIICLVMPMTASVLPKTVHAEDTPGNGGQVPTPFYEFTFDQGTVVSGSAITVNNSGSKSGVSAVIEGNATIEEDTERASKVLNLPGGSLNAGDLKLPADMYADVTSAGFAFSFWVKIDPSAGHYNRIFSSSTIPLNSNNGDGGQWNAPEFTFVAGGTDTSSWRYNTSIMLSDKTNKAQLIWGKEFTKGTWQHVTVSASPTAYDVYLDGKAISTTDKNNNLSTILTKLFEENGELKKYAYNAIGRSVYSTDNDLKAKIDEFRFYNTALTPAQALAAYDSYKVDTGILNNLKSIIDNAKKYSPSFYTKSSYDNLQSKIGKAEGVLANPVTSANVENMIQEINASVAALSYYPGINAETTFSNSQLISETAEADKLLALDLTNDSLAALQTALKGAKEVIAKGNGATQTEVDEKLLALREAVENISYGPTLNFDAAKNTGDLLHGSTGFLYGVSENNVPSMDLLKAVAPKIMVQKAADGQQHPSGDGYRLSSYLQECGVENIQIYLQDYYLQWPYESNGINDYNEKVQAIVSKMLAGKSKEEIEKYSFVIFNEPDNIWYGGKLTEMCTDWKKIYTTIKQISPYAKVAGPNFAGYNSSSYETFFKYCSENNCLPEFITWHELQKDKLTSYKSHYEHMQNLIKTYYAASGIKPIIFVNETVNFEDVGAPGPLVNWISIFEETKVYASLPYWGLANSMNELAADTNKPNGAWWVYKWYADMKGYTIPLTTENIGKPSSYGSLYGLSSVDQNNSTIYTLFGGQAGKQNICIKDIKSIPAFADKTSAHVKIYRTKYTGHHGFADNTPVEFEGDITYGNDLRFTVKDAELMDAYYAIITPAASTDAVGSSSYEKQWEKTYEAENATLLGSAKAFIHTSGSDLARSNRADVGAMNKEGDGVEFSVNVPKDGRYRLNIYYSSQAPQVNPLTLEYVASGGQNRAIGEIVQNKLNIDGQDVKTLNYESTVKWGYFNYGTVYVDLKAGDHKIRLTYQGEDQNGKDLNSMKCALIDKIDLSYDNGANNVVINPEELTGNNTYTFMQTNKGYQGAGYALGSGDFYFYVNAPKDGLYDMNLIASGSTDYSISKSAVIYATDANAESPIGSKWINLSKGSVSSSEFTNLFNGSVYLTAGINKMKISASSIIALDKIIFSYNDKATENNNKTIEAEDAALSGNKTEDGYNYLPGSSENPKIVENPYASGGKAVEGFRGGSNLNNNISFKVKVPTAGDYKLSMFYSNNEPAPVMKTQSGTNYVHPYNTDLVERYAQISVNGEQSQTVYFRNTLCWDVFKNVVLDVTLKAGENTITVANNNSYKFSSVQDDFTPRLDKFIISPSVITGVPTTNTTPSVPTPSVPSTSVEGAALATESKAELVAASGNYTPIAITTTDNKGKMEVAVDIPKNQVESIIEKSGTSEIIIPVGSENLEKVIKNSASAEVKISVHIPTEMNTKQILDSTHIILSSKLLEAVGTEKNILISVDDMKGSVLYSWSFEKSSFADSDKKMTDIDLSLKVSKASENKDLSKSIKENSEDGIILEFAHNGSLPVQSRVKVYVGNYMEKLNQKVYVYHHNDRTNKLDELPFSSNYMIDENGYVSIDLVHCSDYVVLPNIPDKKSVTTLEKQIVVKANKKTILLGGDKKQNAFIQITLPETLQIVKTQKDKTFGSAVGAVIVSYKSQNSKIAVVDNKGKITAKKAGKTNITTTIKLFNGKKASFATQIEVRKVGSK
jgi:Carbohydrate binding module (family 6)./Uncharacterised Sugar-binding Domain./Glycosyl hydrolases family 39.